MVSHEKKDEAGGLFALPYPAHTLPHLDVVARLSTNPTTGLENSEASRRLAQHGPNELEASGGVQPLRIFAEQIFNAMTLVLVLALGASFGIQAWIEGGILGGIIVFNIFLGFFQTLQAEKTMESLKTLGSPRAVVLRGGRVVEVGTAEVVSLLLVSAYRVVEIACLECGLLIGERFRAISSKSPLVIRCPLISVSSMLST